jgi:acyl-CoA thioester hydrolase
VRRPLADAGPTDRLPPFRFSCRSVVEVHETDLGAVVYYGRYPLHIDRAVIAHREHLGVPGLGPPGHVFVVRALAIEYRASAVYGDEVETFVRVSRLGRTSHELEVRLERLGRAPAPLAEARLTIVGLQAYGGRPSAVPEEMRRAILAFEQPGAPS